MFGAEERGIDKKDGKNINTFIEGKVSYMATGHMCTFRYHTHFKLHFTHNLGEKP